MKRRRVIGYDDQGRAAVSYPSVSAAARDRQVLRGSVERAMELGTRCTGLRWAREGDPAPLSDPQRGYVTYDAAGGVAGRYATQVEVAQALGVSSQGVYLSVRTGSVIRGVRVCRAQAPAPGPLVRDARHVVAYDDAGAVIGTYESQVQAARALGESVTAVHHSLNGRRLRQGVRVRRKAAPPPGAYVDSAKLPVRLYDNAGVLGAEYPSRTAAAEALKVPVTSVAHALARGIRLQGWRVVDADAPAPGPYVGQGARVVEALTDAGDLVGRYASQSAAAAAHGVSQSALSHALRWGTRCRGLRWRYAEPADDEAPSGASHTESTHHPARI
ncbi:hypothetical protein [Deinococcus sp. JMULE3]|uniref:hypothetical protein n=1 Tax=Deinococcus sp. JMULE3 TaxID=2518341 RepID=UPI001576DD96|nr:hypothetical protein [Deinococcus sp. JMULE3]NTX99258.1 hypothetical protein [Deinococcus sp. JMULE3]